VNNIPGHHDVKELQKTAMLGTAHIHRKVLTYKCKRAKTGTRDRGTIDSNDGIAATLYSLGTWFVSGICVWIPCIKETMMMVMIMIIIIIIIIKIKAMVKFTLEQAMKVQRGSRGIALLFL
jgi:hypothetical protein